jgi:triosephosphate isomerase
MLLVSNWKMNLSHAEALTLADGIGNLNSKFPIVICPSFVHIPDVYNKLKGKANLIPGAQDCSANGFGAHTGEVSAKMLAELGCKYVIVGHAEKRKACNESYEIINQKTINALNNQITPIICVGERKKAPIKVTTQQIIDDLKAFPNLAECIIAYEPNWAIGSNITPNPQDVLQIICAIKQSYGEKMQVMYGGSVNEDNVKLFHNCDLSGFLLGGSSQKIETFKNLLNALGN